MTVAEGGVSWRKWLVYCEGFHDRDFLSGLFGDALGWRNLRDDKSHPAIEKGKGVHAWERGDRVVTLLPSEGLDDDPSADSTRSFFHERLKTLAAKRVAGLALCLDEDDAPTAGEARSRARQRVTELIRRAGVGSFDEERSILTVADAEVAIRTITWCDDDAASDLVPPRQNLERLVVAACTAAHPARGALVRAWLASRGDDVPAGAAARDKAFSWSHMAGWFPEPGGQSFFRALWQRDAAIAAALRRRMAACGIDDLLTAMDVTPPWRSTASR